MQTRNVIDIARRRKISVKELASLVLSGALHAPIPADGGRNHVGQIALELKMCEGGYCKRLFVRPIGSGARDCPDCERNAEARARARQAERQRRSPIVNLATRRKNRILLAAAARSRAESVITGVLTMPVR